MALYDNTTISKTQNVRVRSSNRFVILMGEQAVGMLQDLRCQDDYAPEPASGIGSINVAEWVPTLARYTISTSQACLFKGALRKIGVSFSDSDDAMKGMVFDIAIFDRTHESTVIPEGDSPITFNAEGKGETLLRTYKKCSFASGDIEIRKHAMVVTNATINACSATTESAAAKI